MAPRLPAEQPEKSSRCPAVAPMPNLETVSARAADTMRWPRNAMLKVSGLAGTSPTQASELQ